MLRYGRPQMPTTNKKPAPKKGSLEAWVARHPYATVSILLHVLLISLALDHVDMFTPKITNTAEHELAREYTRESRHQAIRERVDDMEAVKQMLEQINNEASSPKVDELETTSASPLELLQKSRDLLREIRKVSDTALQEKLEALAQDEERQVELNQAEESTTEETAEEENQLNDEEILQIVAENQQQARELFDKLVRSEKAKQEGNTASADGGQGEGQSEGAGESGNSATGVGGGMGAGGTFDPNNPFSVESHFSQFAQGLVQDISDEMKNMYSAQSGEATRTGQISKDLNAPKLGDRDRLFFSRKITESGRPALRIALDSWYFIGPFPNPGRINLDTRFPPELGIDLNAVYIGDNDRLLRWEYIQYKHLPIIPADFTDYAVYYAYTELYLETARAVWLAIGSDDQSKLWINDILVWRSSEQEKVWSLNEGYRKVQLKAGRNKFLFRLENGVERAAFSIVITDSEILDR